MTAANIGNFKISIGTNASPQVMTELEEVLELSGFGEENELVDVTNWDSDIGSKEYIAGLADGSEFTVTANWISGATSHQRAVRADKGSTRLCRIVYGGTSPNQVWTGSVVLMGWSLTPSTSEQNQCEFSFKITGALTEAGGA